MKKVLLSCCAIAMFGLVSCSDSKEKYKTKFINDCKSMAEKQTSNEAAKKIYNEYCECSGQKVVEKLSMKEIEEMDKMQTAVPDQAKQQEVQAKLMPILQPCMTEMQNKANAMNGAGSTPGAR